jgi:hypothetical protein
VKAVPEGLRSRKRVASEGGEERRDNGSGDEGKEGKEGDGSGEGEEVKGKETEACGCRWWRQSTRDGVRDADAEGKVPSLEALELKKAFPW